jgi:hypothetical protein
MSDRLPGDNQVYRNARSDDLHNLKDGVEETPSLDRAVTHR